MDGVATGTIAGMFAMLSGAWPRVTAGGLDLAELGAHVAAGRRSAADLDAAVEALVGETVAGQVGAGMGLVTDGHVRWAEPDAAVLRALATGDTGQDGMLVRAWRATAAAAAAVGPGVAAAQAVPGPYSLARLDVAGLPDGREGSTLGLAVALAGELVALARAGCPVVVVEEPAAVRIGADAAEGALFAAAQDRLLAGSGDTAGMHPMLAITGGSAAGTAPEWVFGAPYRSYLFDLITGPDNWVLVRAAPPERGIVCGALTVDGAGGDQVPQLVWAAHYAASAGGRGLDRVGLANATRLTALDPAVARAALDMLGRAADLASMPLGRAVEAGLDPRTVRSRSATRGPVPPEPPGSPRRELP